MRIAILAHLHHPIAEPFAGGTEAHTASVADGLVRRGHRVDLFAKEGSVTAASLHPIVPAGFTFGVDSGGVLDAAVDGAIGSIRSLGVDVVLNNSLGPAPYTSMDDLPMLTVLHTPPTLDKVIDAVSDPRWMPGRRHRWVAVSAVNAAAWAPLLRQVGGIDVVHNGIDPALWAAPAPAPGAHAGLEPASGSPSGPDAASAPAPWPPPAADLAVWTGRIVPEKGLHLAIDAAAAAGMRIDFAGPVSDPAYFAGIIEPRLGDRVHYRGHLSHNELPAFLASGAVFIASPLWAEPFGLAAVEAMMTGTPVAALPNGALPEVVAGGAGHIAAEESAPALADAISRAARCDRGRVAELAGRFSLGTMLGRYEALLAGIATHG